MSRGVRPVAPEAEAAEEAEATETVAALEEPAPELEAAEEDAFDALTRRNAENIERDVDAAASMPADASFAVE